MEYLLVCDVEASGQNPNTHFLVQIGLALVKISTPNEIVRMWSSYVRKPENRFWEERCVKEFWSQHLEKFEKAQKQVLVAPYAEEVLRSLDEFISELPPSTRLAADSTFDFTWIDSLLRGRNHLYFFGDKRDVFELSSFYLGLGMESSPDGWSRKAALRALKLEPPTELVRHDHDAAHDAANIAVFAAHILNTLRKRAASENQNGQGDQD
jgi:inhibitor of KinA sporulation pathway (predicted exonuclease)